jgi:glycine cleavage system H lipoate-binding protein
MKGRIEFKVCTHDYKCANCDFDQYFNDQYSVHAVVSPVDVLDIEGFKVPQGYYFHPGHTWIKVEEGSSVRVGIDEFALRLLGPLDRIEAPLMGKEVKQGRADIGVYRSEHQARVLSPVSGVVTAINPKLREEGELANQDPYTAGWLMSVHCNNLRGDLKNLVINKETGDFIEGEVERLYELIEEVAGPLAADGGDLSQDIYGQMPQLGWERLTKVFLKS